MPERPTSPLAVIPVVAVGGVLGSLVRAWVDALLPRADAGAWPWSTLLVNVVGAFTLGVVLVLLAARTPAAGLGQLARPFLVTGLLGGLTTFSAYSEQVRDLLASGRAGTALTYAVGSVLAGVGAVVAGRLLAHRTGGTPPLPTGQEVDEG